MNTPTEASSVNKAPEPNGPRGSRRTPYVRLLLACVALAPWPLISACYSPDQLCPSAGPTECPQFFPHEMHQATCSVARTECAAWTADATSPTGFNCTSDNLTDVALTITTCFDPTTTNATAACNALCTNATSYPLAPQVVPGGAVICQSNLNPGGDVEVLDGQCSMAPGADPGPTSAVTCTLGGRQCNKPGFVTSPDGVITQFCGAMPTHMYSISPTSVLLKGCFDPNVMSAQTFCQNKGMWPDNPIPGTMSPVEFPWVNVASFTPNSPLCAPATTTPGAVTFGIASGITVGSVQAAGSTANLIAKGGSFSTTRSCDSDGEFCTTNLASMKVVLSDVTLAGFTVANPEIDLVSPVNAGFAQSIDPSTMTLQVAADIPGFRRDFVYASPPTPLSVATTPTTLTLSGAFPITVNGLNGNVFSGNVTMTIPGSTSTGSSCTGQSPLQSLLGFESTQYWSSSQVQVSLDSANHTQGCFGLDVGGSGYRTINSGQIQTPIAGATSTLALDVFVPPNQPNPFYLGAIQMYLSCPSANQFNMYIGQDELTGKPVGQFSTLAFPIPSPILQVMNGSHPDCTFSIAVNMNQTPTLPVLDNLRFQ